MPDDQDYQELGRLLANPTGWSEQELATMQSILQNQRTALEGLHPLDHRGRRRLEALTAQIEAAVHQRSGD